jgi:hypothetical protein
MTMSNCVVKGNACIKNGSYGAFGGGVFVDAASVMLLRDSMIANNKATSTWADEATGGAGIAVRGSCVLRNCLIAGNSKAGGYGDGLHVYSGAATLMNCTVADNSGQGLYRYGGTVTITNSIVWGNGSDINGAATLVYSDTGNAGTNGGNISVDPLFERGFYLATNSPCQNAGTNSALFWGLTNYTTRVDGEPDNNANVNLGYHYPTGYNLGVGVFYVSASGNDASNGTSWASAFRTITKAISVAQDGTVIHVGAGNYTNGLESFPLTLAYLNGAQIRATNRETTVINAAGSTQRVMTITSCSGLDMRNVTLAGGYVTGSGYNLGGGLYVGNCGGIVMAGCAITNNTAYHGGANTYSRGGGLYSAASVITMTNCLVKGNTCSKNASYGAEAGGIYVDSGSTLVLRDSVITDNSAAGAYGGRIGGGMVNLGPCALKNCLIAGNTTSGGQGDGLYVSSAATLESCTVADNTGQGIYRSGGAVTVTHSILWGNGVDIVGSATVSWSDSGNGVTNGVNGCLSADPLFDRGYYLAAASPCVDAGTNGVSYWGWSNYTTRVNGSNDSGQVDLGYHYSTGLDSAYADLYVSPNGSDSGHSGTNWADAFRTITKALSMAQDGTTIHVGAGNYTNGLETFPLTLAYLKGVQIQGTNSAATVINAAGSSKRVMTVTSCSGLSLQSVTLTGGYATNTGGGGLYAANCGGLVLSGCAITSNTFYTASANSYGYGGGLYSVSSIITLDDCLVSGNTSRKDQSYNTGGGGIYADAGSITVLRDSVVVSNRAGGWGTTMGGGVGSAGACTLRNCLIARNSAGSGGQGDGLYLAANSTLESCTVANNTNQGVYRAGGSVGMTNCIAWDNGDDLAGAMTMVYCDIQSVDSFWTNGVNGCLSADPLFVWPATNSFRLTKHSPCVNAGMNFAWMVNASDLDGNPRVRAGKVDMGAYECQSVGGTMFVIR